MREELLGPLDEGVAHGLLLRTLVEVGHRRQHAVGGLHAELHGHSVDVGYLRTKAYIHILGIVAQAGHHIAHLLLGLVFSDVATIEAVAESRRHHAAR